MYRAVWLAYLNNMEEPVRTYLTTGNVKGAIDFYQEKY
jgi:hypothetical protein